MNGYMDVQSPRLIRDFIVQVGCIFVHVMRQKMDFEN